MLQFEGKGNGYLRDVKRSYLPQPFDVEVPRWMVERNHLQPGLLVEGLAAVRNMKRVMTRIDTLEGADPIAVARRTHFHNLTATDPTERLVMETRPDELIGRVLDLISPIGLGARGLVLVDQGIDVLPAVDRAVELHLGNAFELGQHVLAKPSFALVPQAGVAVCLKRAETGALPQVLPEGLPKDPFSGQDFQYERKGAGFVLRCRGKDLAKNKTYEYAFGAK